MKTRFVTKNLSTYEVDHDACTCIRLRGVGDTPDSMRSVRQYSEISEIEVGRPVIVVWSDDEDSCRAAVTSPVIEVLEDDDSDDVFASLRMVAAS